MYHKLNTSDLQHLLLTWNSQIPEVIVRYFAFIPACRIVSLWTFYVRRRYNGSRRNFRKKNALIFPDSIFAVKFYIKLNSAQVKYFHEWQTRKRYSILNLRYCDAWNQISKRQVQIIAMKTCSFKMSSYDNFIRTNIK